MWKRCEVTPPYKYAFTSGEVLVSQIFPEYLTRPGETFTVMVTYGIGPDNLLVLIDSWRLEKHLSRGAASLGAPSSMESSPTIIKAAQGAMTPKGKHRNTSREIIT